MLWSDVRGSADTSALAAIHRALRFTRKDRDPCHKERMYYIPKLIVVFMCLAFLWPYTGTISIST